MQNSEPMTTCRCQLPASRMNISKFSGYKWRKIYCKSTECEMSFFYWRISVYGCPFMERNKKWMKCIESRDQIWKTWGFRTLQRWKDKKIDNLNGKRNCQKFTYNWQNKENNFIFFYKPPKLKTIKRIQCITLLLHLSEYCAELNSYLYTL